MATIPVQGDELTRPAGPGEGGLPPLELTAVVPCFNEADSVDLAHERITRELERYGEFELLFVDDGSTDATLERIRALAAADQRVKYLSFSRNFGQEAAFSAGFKYATKPWTVQFDADLQWPPEEVHKLLARTAEGYDVVFGIRERRQDPRFRRVGAAASQWLASSWLGIELPRGASAFRVVRSSVAKKIVGLRLVTPYFIATVPRVGARYTVLIVHRPRLRGTSKWGVRQLAADGLELLFGFSLRPLMLAYLFSAVAVLVGLTLAGFGRPASSTPRWSPGRPRLEILTLVALPAVPATWSGCSGVRAGHRSSTSGRPTSRSSPRTTCYGHERAGTPITHRGLAPRGTCSSSAPAPTSCRPTWRPGAWAAARSASTSGPTPPRPGWPTTTWLSAPGTWRRSSSGSPRPISPGSSRRPATSTSRPRRSSPSTTVPRSGCRRPPLPPPPTRASSPGGGAAGPARLRLRAGLLPAAAPGGDRAVAPSAGRQAVRLLGEARASRWSMTGNGCRTRSRRRAQLLCW